MQKDRIDKRCVNRYQFCSYTSTLAGQVQVLLALIAMTEYVFSLGSAAVQPSTSGAN